MHNIKLTYFDFHGGRGEAARLAMFIGGIDFEDRRVPFGEWAALKPETPFGGMPVLEVDGESVTQSNGINRFVGKLAGLYPDDPWQAALCDEAMDAVEDITSLVVATFSIRDKEELKAKRQALADGPISFYLERLQRRLIAHGGEYFADDRLTVADLKVFVWIRHLRSGNLDHVPRDLPDRVATLLVEHCERVKNHPQVVAYYEQHGGT
jgi:glutathione S-transferase